MASLAPKPMFKCRHKETEWSTIWDATDILRVNIGESHSGFKHKCYYYIFKGTLGVGSVVPCDNSVLVCISIYWKSSSHSSMSIENVLLWRTKSKWITIDWSCAKSTLIRRIKKRSKNNYNNNRDMSVVSLVFSPLPAPQNTFLRKTATEVCINCRAGCQKRKQMNNQKKATFQAVIRERKICNLIVTFKCQNNLYCTITIQMKYINTK